MAKALREHEETKYLILCEGTDEKAIIDILLDKKKLIFDRSDLVGSVVYHARQIKNPVIIKELERFNKPVTTFRVGDKQSDKIEIPSHLKKILAQNRIFKYCTKPELEILLIINENLVDKFKKSKQSADNFAKSNIKFKGTSYSKSTKFYNEYYGGNRINNLVSNLIEYKRTHKKHKKDEKYLADLLK